MIWAGIMWFRNLPRVFHIALGAVALCGLLLTLHKCAVSDAIKDDRAENAAKVSGKTLEAERTANANDATRKEEMADKDAANRKAIKDAEEKDPEGAHAPAGPSLRAIIDSLRGE